VFVVDLDVLERNVRAMADHASQFGVALRPHAKTHKTVEIARMQLAAGALGLTLAKIGEVEGLLDGAPKDEPLPLQDVLLAFPIVGQEKLGRLLELGRRVRVTVSLDSPDAASQLGEAAAAQGTSIGILVEVDTGGRRCGVLPGQPTLDLARHVAGTPGLTLRGIMTHEGHAYGATPETLREVSQQAGRVMVELGRMLRADGHEAPVISVGSTPSARHIAEVPGVTDIRPGTYVFQDYNQIRLGVATEDVCAGTVHATVIARPAPDRAVVDAGTKAVAADRGMVGGVTPVQQEGYGCVKGQAGWHFARASEEHGVLLRLDMGHADDLRVGDRVELIPNHICPAVNLFDRLVVQRDGIVQGSWAVAARGRTR
jgi:D-serine deaminase-like pyridoxal phosphate-dependent protein